uniref:Uncharacterized protein n=1 Tax=Amphimedon queenslandica TaxID=400682 RepID=A0A1X7VF50_AMPQE
MAMSSWTLFLFSLMVVLCSAKLPMFSWDTLPVFFHSGNESGLYSEESIKTIAKFPMVTIEKFQSDLIPGVDDEDDMMLVMIMVKRVNPNVATYFYMNSYKDRPEMTRMARELADQHPDWYLRDSNGTKVKNAGQGYYAFDVSNPDVRQWWKETCLTALNITNGDGCFCDSSGSINASFIPPLSPEKEKAWGDGLLQLTKEVQDALGDDKLLIGKFSNQSYVKSIQIEFFAPNNASIVELMLGATVGQVIQAHVPVKEDCAGDLTNYMAAFLIGAGKYCYFGCGHWNTQNDDKSAFLWKPEYDKPLGAPNGPATYKNGVWRREFSRGTTVEFDTSTNTGTIKWGT